MTPQEALGRLGLEHLAAGPGRRLPAPPHPAVGFGFKAPERTLDAAVAAGPDALEAAPVRLRAADDVGLALGRLTRNPDILVVWCDQGRPRVKGLEDASAAVREASDRVLIDAPRLDRPLAILSGPDVGLVVVPSVEGEQRGLLVEAFGPPIAVRPPPEMRSDVAIWARECAGDDPWLAGEVRERLAREGPLPELVALGLLARLRGPPAEAGARRAAVDRLLRVSPDADLDRERVFVHALDEATQEGLADAAIAAADLLFEELAHLGAAPWVGDVAWREAFRAALHERDDLEGVRVLLAGARSGERLVRTLASVDELGEELVHALPFVPGLEDDERLRRALSASPEGWWAVPATWGWDEGS